MILRRRVVKLAESEKVSSTIHRLEDLADNLEVTAKALEDLVAHLKEDEEAHAND